MSSCVGFNRNKPKEKSKVKGEKVKSERSKVKNERNIFLLLAFHF
jgi:hypothetical protein